MYSRSLALPAYGVALLLVLFPLLDSVLTVWPIRAGEFTWRFAAAGLFSRVLLTLFLGYLVAYAVSVVCGHRRTTRTLAVVAYATSVLLVAGIAMFAMDTLQMRMSLLDGRQQAFDAASAVTLLKYMLATLVSAGFGWRGWVSSRAPRAVAARTSADALLVGRSLGAQQPQQA